MLFALAHALQLEDGSYAVRSLEFPGCEARNARIELAREEFAEALRECLLRMIEAGAVPPLHTYEELGASFASRCTVQIPAPDRLAGSFDRVMAVRAKLPPDAAARLARMHPTQGAQHPEVDASRPQSDEHAPPDTSAGEEENRGSLDPSARLALVAARLAGRDRRAE